MGAGARRRGRAHAGAFEPFGGVVPSRSDGNDNVPGAGGDKPRPYGAGRRSGQSRQMSSMDSTRWFARPRTDNRKKHM